MGCTRLLIIGLLACQLAAAPGLAGERTSRGETPAARGGGKAAGGQVIKAVRVTEPAPLDRVAVAVDGAESSHGRDLAMWRADPSGPQGPMQVSEAAASDVGGGDRFDMEQNRALGRAYLALLHQRYGNWPDAVAAYNWGMGRMDAWIKAGRQPGQLLPEVAVYQSRVLNESGLCTGTTPQPQASQPDRLVSAACIPRDEWRGGFSLGIGPSGFVKKLDRAVQLAVVRAAQAR